MSKKFVRKRVCNKLSKKVNNWQKEIPDASTLTQPNQCNTGKEDFEQKMGILKITYQMLKVYWLLFFLSLRQIENKNHDVIGLIKKTVYDPKMLDVEKKYFTTSYYNKFTWY